MPVSYLVIAALAICAYLLAYRLSRKNRLIVALLIFGVGSVAFTMWVARNLDDRPAPGDVPYHASAQ
jgi:hypothetical protein